MTNLVTNMFNPAGAGPSAPTEASGSAAPTVGFEQILTSAQQFAMNMNAQNPEFVQQMRERMNLSNLASNHLLFFFFFPDKIKKLLNYLN